MTPCTHLMDPQPPVKYPFFRSVPHAQTSSRPVHCCLTMLCSASAMNNLQC